MKQQLSDEELGEVAGGFASWKPLLREYRFRFNDDEVTVLHKEMNVRLIPYREYTTSDLINLGIPGKNGGEIEQYLRGQFGFSKL